MVRVFLVMQAINVLGHHAFRKYTQTVHEDHI